MSADPRSIPRTEEHLIAVEAGDVRRRIAGIVKKLERSRAAGTPPPPALLEDLASERAQLRALNQGSRNPQPITPRPLTSRQEADR